MSPVFGNEAKESLYEDIAWRVREYGWKQVALWLVEIVAYIMEWEAQ